MRMTVRQPLASYPDPVRAVSAWQLLQCASTSSLPLSADELFWAQAGSAQQSRAADTKDRRDFFDMVSPFRKRTAALRGASIQGKRIGLACFSADEGTAIADGSPEGPALRGINYA